MPVTFNKISGARVCVNFLIAPAALLWFFVSHAFMNIWYDLIELAAEMKRSVIQKHSKRVEPVGNIIELDPQKKYVALIKTSLLDFVDIQEIARCLEINGSILVLPELSGLRFVEHTGNFKQWGIVEKGDLSNADCKASSKEK